MMKQSLGFFSDSSIGYALLESLLSVINVNLNCLALC